MGGGGGGEERQLDDGAVLGGAVTRLGLGEQPSAQALQCLHSGWRGEGQNRSETGRPM